MHCAFGDTNMRLFKNPGPGQRTGQSSVHKLQPTEAGSGHWHSPAPSERQISKARQDKQISMA